MKTIHTLFLILFAALGFSQGTSIKGQLQGHDGEALMFANITLLTAQDSSITKIETSDEAGVFKFQSINPGEYFIKVSYVGVNDLSVPNIKVNQNRTNDIGVLVMSPSSVQLDQAIITASRVMVEVKADRTVFNVEGTINSSGSDAIELLRMAPGVVVDNNDNISVLGRSGVLVFVDGRRLPLGGQDLTDYLKNLPSDQIDKIDIITNPGARYEAEGNAGIIDIRLKKDKKLGSNGNLSGSLSNNRYTSYNLNGSGNFRNKVVNVFGTAGMGSGKGFHDIVSKSWQNGIFLDEINNSSRGGERYNYRLGADFFVAKNQTIGVLWTAGNFYGENSGYNEIKISDESNMNQIDSTLEANSYSSGHRINNSFNLNYKIDFSKENNLNVDIDYGMFENDSDRSLTNDYYNQEGLLSSNVDNNFETPTDIRISTAKLDYEHGLLGGKLGLGTKLSQVKSDNTFYHYDVVEDQDTLNNDLSNIFKYNETVYAAYANYAWNINPKTTFSAGLRAEYTDVMGDLKAFTPDLAEDPVNIDYLDWFPSAGITYQLKPKQTISLNYGRRINRPDYNVLNPFNYRMSELSYMKGNPFIRPEIVNNIELGYTLNYRYNFKFAYSKTTDQITRLISPDENDPRAGFISWDNLAEQTVWNFNVSAPVQIAKFWSSYFNANASYISNKAEYENGATVDLSVLNYVLFTQQTFNLPMGINAEISGFFSGPGIWGGVFRYEETFGVNVGLQKKFLNKNLNVKLSARDIFNTTGWNGYSEFNGLYSEGSGRMGRQSVSVSANYRFGNQNVRSRKRSTGLEDEAGRINEGG